MNALKAYQTTFSRIGQARDRDAAELASVTAALLRADDEAARSAAIEETRKLWTRCGVNACHDASGMPEALKSSVMTLAGNMIRACERARAEDPGSVTALIEVNRQVLSGLQPAQMPSAARYAFQPRVRQVA